MNSNPVTQLNEKKKREPMSFSPHIHHTVWELIHQQSTLLLSIEEGKKAQVAPPRHYYWWRRRLFICSSRLEEVNDLSSRPTVCLSIFLSSRLQVIFNLPPMFVSRPFLPSFLVWFYQQPFTTCPRSCQRPCLLRLLHSLRSPSTTQTHDCSILCVKLLYK